MASTASHKSVKEGGGVWGWQVEAEAGGLDSHPCPPSQLIGPTSCPLLILGYWTGHSRAACFPHCNTYQLRYNCLSVSPVGVDSWKAECVDSFLSYCMAQIRSPLHFHPISE